MTTNVGTGCIAVYIKTGSFQQYGTSGGADWSSCFFRIQSFNPSTGDVTVRCGYTSGGNVWGASATITALYG